MKLKELVKPLASLKFTIALLAMSILLVYAGTWAQVDTGIWTVQKTYFHSLWVWVDFQVFLPRPEAGHARVPGGFPMPGGYSIGAMMLVNLLAAHWLRFKFTARRSGIILIHLGLILLLLGELATSLLAVESQMTIDEGQTVAYSKDIRFGELAVIDPSSPTSDTVVAFGESSFVPGRVLRNSLLPFEIKVDDYFANSQILGPKQAPPGSVSKATAGDGRGIVVAPREVASGTDGGTVDMASMYVTLAAGGRPLGTYLVSYFFDEPQEIKVDGKIFLIALRFQRYYKPYTMHLIKFSHDRYLGTDTPRNFSSRVRVVDPENNVDREVLIRMNEPLRYGGETYYQASFKPDDKTTILQVVRNPAWTMPYIACAVGAAGMLIHFGLLLVAFLQKRSRKAALPLSAQLKGGNAEGTVMKPGRHAGPVSASDKFRPLVFPGAVLALGLLYVGSVLSPPAAPKPDQFDFAGFGDIPVTFDGRVLPLDTLARTSLQAISGRQGTKVPASDAPAAEWGKIPFKDWKSVPATRWLADVLANTDRADEYRIFRIDNPELLGMLGLEEDRSPRLYSFREVLVHQDKLQEQITRIMGVEDKKRDLFQRKVTDLYQRLQIYLRLSELGSLYLVPPMSGTDEWQPIGKFMPTKAAPAMTTHPAARSMLNLLSAYHDNSPGDFNAELAKYRTLVAQKVPREAGTASFEAFFNRFDPFYQSQILYVTCFILGCASWLGWHRPLGRAAFGLLVLSLAIHTFGLGARIMISGRPPVTNLYSSAVFIAWFGVLLAAILESFYRNVIATVMSSAMGFTSLLIAHHLAGDGDTMKQMQAVLDTNFWLATHVVAITLGYAATFLAGVLAVSYIIIGIFTPMLTASKPGRADEDAPAHVLPRMVYAVLCFAMLFSFVGTILGGIWADQSWGRFWGWDPKENGAVLIVIWNALILHARWAGLVKARGLMLLAVFGNVVTGWSWFGTNMLGVGLHSYGFMDSALFWLLMFVGSQMLLIALGNLPLGYWASFRLAGAGKSPDGPNPSSAPARTASLVAGEVSSRGNSEDRAAGTPPPARIPVDTSARKFIQDPDEQVLLKSNLVLSEGEAGFKNLLTGKFRVTELTAILTSKRFVACKRRKYFPWGPLIWLFIALMKRKIVFSIPLDRLASIRSEGGKSKSWILKTVEGQEFNLMSDDLFDKKQQWIQGICAAVFQNCPGTKIDEAADLVLFKKA